MRSPPAQLDALSPLRIGRLPIALPIIARADAVDRGRAGHLRGGGFIEQHRRPAARASRRDGVAQQAPIGADRLVGLAEMLAGAVLDRAHGLAGPLVVHVDVGPHAGEGLVRLLVRIEAVLVALVLARHVVGQLVEREPLAAHLVLVHRRPEAGEDRVPVVPGIVDRHMPLRDRHLAAHRNDEGVGEHQVGDPHMGVGVADAAQRRHPQARNRSARPRCAGAETRA